MTHYPNYGRNLARTLGFIQARKYPPEILQGIRRLLLEEIRQDHEDFWHKSRQRVFLRHQAR